MTNKRRPAQTIAAPPVQPKRPWFSAEAVARLARKVVGRPAGKDGFFAPAAPPPGVDAGFAMDDALVGYGQWAYGQVGAYGYAGPAEYPAALPLPVLASHAQRAEFWKISDVPAAEMTRRWVKITSVDQEEDKSDRIQAIEDALKRFKVRDAFRNAIRNDGLMGRGHVFIDLGTDDVATPIGNGRNAASKQKIGKGGLKSIRSLEPMWIYPTGYNASNPLAPDWYKPQTWNVMGRQVHASRLLTITAREVPDILKPAYAFGGLSLTQLALPYVENWLRARQSVADLIESFSVFVLQTDMQSGLMGGPSTGDGAGLDARVNLFNAMRSNRGTFVIDKNAEGFQNVSANLGTLDHLQAQAQEQMASVASQPLVKMFGIQPTGLNASSDGEIRVWYDTIHAMQEDHIREPLETIVDLIQLNEFGDIDDSIRISFEPLWAMSDKERAEVENLEADTDNKRLDGGVLAQMEIRKQVANDPDSRYPGLDVEDVPDLSAEEAEGLEPKGETGEDGALDHLFQAGS